MEPSENSFERILLTLCVFDQTTLTARALRLTSFKAFCVALFDNPTKTKTLRKSLRDTHDTSWIHKLTYPCFKMLLVV